MSASRDDHRASRRRIRSRSPARLKDDSSKRPRRDDSREHVRRAVLPYQAKTLHKHHLDDFRPLLATYLDLQKEIDIDALDEREVKGRWKSFLGKWNRGELSEGYYDPETKARADARFGPRQPAREEAGPRRASPDEVEGDDYGPRPARGAAPGVSVPSRQDLDHRDEMIEEDKHTARDQRKIDRKRERKQQTERLDEIAPRAEAGTRERQLEKKREKAEANRSFREKSPGADEVNDRELMGEGGDADSFKAQLKENERRKTEREIRKEEILRARAVEREERLTKHREKEDKTMEMLKAIAKQRFG